jgi:hypothetical protein
MSCASALLGTPGSSPAPEATLERGAPRENPGELAVYLRNRHLGATAFRCVVIHDPRYHAPWVVATNLPVSAYAL